MTKGDKLLRSLRQLFEMNRHKLRDKVGACAIARHLQCFILTKNWIDGSELVKNERGKANEQGTDDQDNYKQVTEDVEMHSENQEEEETKDEPITDTDHAATQDELQRRGRGRPRKGDTTEYKPSP